MDWLLVLVIGQGLLMAAEGVVILWLVTKYNDQRWQAEEYKRLWKQWRPPTGTVLALCFLPGAVRAQGNGVIPSTAGAVRAALEDARQHAAEATYLRYAWVPWDSDGVELALSLWVHKVSLDPRVTLPRRVAPGLWALRGDRYGGLFLRVWESLANVDPYFHEPLTAVKRVEVVKRKVKKVWPGGPDERGQVFPKGYEYESEVEEPKVTLSDAVTGAAGDLPRAEWDALCKATGSAAPVVRADWWVVTASRQINIQERADTGCGYYDWLGIKDRDTFFALGGVDKALSARLGRDDRAATHVSRVNRGDRQVERFQGVTGDLWITLDSKVKTGTGNALERLKDGAFVHQAEEAFVRLPNGLYAYLASNDKGERQDSVPDFVGGDTSDLCEGLDRRIHPGISCDRCHATGLKAVNGDQLRRTIKPAQAGLNVADKREADLLEQRFLSDLTQFLTDDNTLYARAVNKACGGGVTRKFVTLAEANRTLAGAFHGYATTGLDAKQAAVEWETTEAELVARFRAATVPVSLAPYKDDPLGTVTRENFEEFYHVGKRIVHGTHPLNVPGGK